MASTQLEPYLTTGQAARIVRCSQQTIIRACDRGLIKSFRLPASSFRRIERQVLRQFMEEHGIPMAGWEAFEQSENKSDQ